MNQYERTLHDEFADYAKDPEAVLTKKDRDKLRRLVDNTRQEFGFAGERLVRTFDCYKNIEMNTYQVCVAIPIRELSLMKSRDLKEDFIKMIARKLTNQIFDAEIDNPYDLPRGFL